MKKYLYYIVVTVLLWSIQVVSQTKSIDRRYIPIVITNYQAPLLNLTYNEWQAYRYNAGNKQWTSVPFQVDELKAPGSYKRNETLDGKIDVNDEFLLMPEDLGDRAPQDRWIVESPVDENRIELVLSDPLDSSKKGWIYLFKDVNPIPAVTNYINRSLPPAKFPAADTVNSNTYRIGHNKEGWIDFVSFSSVPDKDLIDRLKMRLAGSVVLIGDVTVTDENIIAQKDAPKGPVTFWEGKIRAFHDERADLKSGDITLPDANYPLQYFPYSMTIGIANFGVTSSGFFKLNTVRQSLDFSEAAIGMKFYSIVNPEGIFIDGNSDALNLGIDQNTSVMWVMASGDVGTILLLITNPKFENGLTQIYYRDDKNGGTNDHTPDTGDLKSYGDMGMWINAPSGSLKIKSLTTGFTIYFIDEPNLDASFGAQMLTWTENPLTLTATEQPYSTSYVDNTHATPCGFYLYPAHPNPYRQGEGTIQFDFTAQSPGQKAECVIYNMLGQTVARIENTAGSTGQNSLMWNGLDDRGQAVPAGVYLYRVQTGSEGMTRKFMLLH